MISGHRVSAAWLPWPAGGAAPALHSPTARAYVMWDRWDPRGLLVGGGKPADGML